MWQAVNIEETRRLVRAHNVGCAEQVRAWLVAKPAERSTLGRLADGFWAGSRRYLEATHQRSIEDPTPTALDRAAARLVASMRP